MKTSFNLPQRRHETASSNTSSLLASSSALENLYLLFSWIKLFLFCRSSFHSAFISGPSDDKDPLVINLLEVSLAFSQLALVVFWGDPGTLVPGIWCWLATGSVAFEMGLVSSDSLCLGIAHRQLVLVLLAGSCPALGSLVAEPSSLSSSSFLE